MRTLRLALLGASASWPSSSARRRPCHPARHRRHPIPHQLPTWQEAWNAPQPPRRRHLLLVRLHCPGLGGLAVHRRRGPGGDRLAAPWRVRTSAARADATPGHGPRPGLRRGAAVHAAPRHPGRQRRPAHRTTHACPTRPRHSAQPTNNSHSRQPQKAERRPSPNSAPSATPSAPARPCGPSPSSTSATARWYKQIAHLNYHHRQPDGGELTNSHWIKPGWRLQDTRPRQGTTSDHATAAAPSRTTPSSQATPCGELAEDKLGRRRPLRPRSSKRLPRHRATRRRPAHRPRRDRRRLAPHASRTAHRPKADTKTSPQCRQQPRDETVTQDHHPATDQPTQQPQRTSRRPPTIRTHRHPPRAPPSRAAAAPRIQPTHPTDRHRSHTTYRADDDERRMGSPHRRRSRRGPRRRRPRPRRRRRRAQQRRRRPGQTLPMPTTAVAESKRAPNDRRPPLRRNRRRRAPHTGSELRRRRQPLPMVRAARLTAEQFDLYLAEPATLPAPWSGTVDATVGHLLADRSRHVAQPT